MLNIPGATRELSTATIVNPTDTPLSVPNPVRVTLCATSSKVAEVNCVAWKLTPEPESLKAALFDCWLESS